MAEKILADCPHTVSGGQPRPIITEELQDQVRRDRDDHPVVDEVHDRALKGVADGDLERVSGVAARDLARVQRGRKLFEEHAGAITFLEGATWLCPGAGTSYLVNLDAQTCECADYTHRGATCKHLVAASVANAKSRTCSCCHERVLGRFTTEVTDDDSLLSWFPGDVLCADCIRAGYWV